MEWNRKYNYPKSVRALVNGKRLYDIGTQKLPSVTTILNVTQDQAKKEGLKRWRAKVGVKEAERITTEAANRGSSMHQYLEDFLHSKLNLDLLGHNSRERMMAEEVIENGLRNQLTEIWGVESCLHFPNKYAGACDLVGIYNGQPTILDFKSSTNLKKEEWILDYYLQGAAYCLAHDEVYGTNINQVAILICTKDNLFQKFVVDGERLADYKKMFLDKVQQYYDIQNQN